MPLPTPLALYRTGERDGTWGSKTYRIVPATILGPKTKIWADFWKEKNSEHFGDFAPVSYTRTMSFRAQIIAIECSYLALKAILRSWRSVFKRSIFSFLQKVTVLAKAFAGSPRSTNRKKRGRYFAIFRV